MEAGGTGSSSSRVGKPCGGVGGCWYPEAGGGNPRTGVRSKVGCGPLPGPRSRGGAGALSASRTRYPPVPGPISCPGAPRGSSAGGQGAWRASPAGAADAAGRLRLPP